MFISNLSSIQIPNNVYGTLKDTNWMKVVLEKINALKKNNTWEIINLLPQKKQYDANRSS